MKGDDSVDYPEISPVHRPQVQEVDRRQREVDELGGEDGRLQRGQAGRAGRLPGLDLALDPAGLIVVRPASALPGLLPLLQRGDGPPVPGLGRRGPVPEQGGSDLDQVQDGVRGEDGQEGPVAGGPEDREGGGRGRRGADRDRGEHGDDTARRDLARLARVTGFPSRQVDQTPHFSGRNKLVSRSVTKTRDEEELTERQRREPKQQAEEVGRVRLQYRRDQQDLEE